MSKPFAGNGADIFVFGTKGGSDVIADFENGLDKIDLSHWAEITDYFDLENNHVSFYQGDRISRLATTG